MNRENILTFSDLIYLVKKYKGRLVLIGLLCSFFSLVFFLFKQPPQFVARASFQQAGKKINGDGGLSSALRLVNISLDEDRAFVSMQSELLLGKAVQKSGLQIWPKNDFEKRRRNARCHILGVADNLEIRDIAGDVQRPIQFRVVFTAPKKFDLLSESGELISSGRLGMPVQLGGVQFVIDSGGLSEKYSLILLPLHTAIQKARCNLLIRPHRQDGRLLNLSFSHENRGTAISFLDALMEQYRMQLRQMHNELVHKQLAYLQERQIETQTEYEKALTQHVAYLQDNLEERGFLHLTQELETLEKPRAELATAQSDLSLALEKWTALRPFDKSLKEGAQHAFEAKANERSLQASSSGLYGEKSQLFAGINLISAERLQEQMTQKGQALAAEIEQLEDLKKRTLDPVFEISALGDFFVDSVGKALVFKGSELQMELLDRSNRSEKELRRLEVAFEKQRNLLLDHVDRRIDFLEEQWRRSGEKLAALRERMIDLIKNEKTLTSSQLKEIGMGMEDLPEKWHLESQIKMKRELSMQTIDWLNRVRESKIMDDQFFTVESRPLDPAFAPVSPTCVAGVSISSLSGLFGVFCSLIWLIFRAPLPISPRFLEERNFKWMKRPRKEQSENFFRTLAYFIPINSAVTLFSQGRRNGDCKELALLLAKREVKVLLVEMGALKEVAETEEGAFWVAKTCGYEELNGPKFFATLERWKENFDTILIQAPWSGHESALSPLKDHCQAAVVYLRDEPPEVVKPLMTNPNTFFVLDPA